MRSGRWGGRGAEGRAWNFCVHPRPPHDDRARPCPDVVGVGDALIRSGAGRRDPPHTYVLARKRSPVVTAAPPPSATAAAPVATTTGTIPCTKLSARLRRHSDAPPPPRVPMVRMLAARGSTPITPPRPSTPSWEQKFDQRGFEQGPHTGGEGGGGRGRKRVRRQRRGRGMATPPPVTGRRNGRSTDTRPTSKRGTWARLAESAGGGLRGRPTSRGAWLGTRDRQLRRCRRRGHANTSAATPTWRLAVALPKGGRGRAGVAPAGAARYGMPSMWDKDRHGRRGRCRHPALRGRHGGKACAAVVLGRQAAWALETAPRPPSPPPRIGSATGLNASSAKGRREE